VIFVFFVAFVPERDAVRRLSAVGATSGARF
jgi:hypothetical protein